MVSRIAHQYRFATVRIISEKLNVLTSCTTGDFDCNGDLNRHSNHKSHDSDLRFKPHLSAISGKFLRSGLRSAMVPEVNDSSKCPPPNKTMCRRTQKGCGRWRSPRRKSERAKGAEKASCGETVDHKGVLIWRVRFFTAPLWFSGVLRARLLGEGGQRRLTLQKTPFWTTVSLHDASSAPLAHPPEKSEVFPKVGPVSWTQTLTGIAFHDPGKCGRNFPKRS